MNSFKKFLFIYCPDYNYLQDRTDLFNYFREFAALIETFPYQGFYLDLTGTERIFGKPLETSVKILTHLKSSHLSNIEIRAGLGSNTLVAFLAAKEAKPFTVNEIIKNKEHAFIGSVPVSNFPNISNKTIYQLRRMLNVSVARDLLPIKKEVLFTLYPNDAENLFNFARNKAPEMLFEEKQQVTLHQQLIFDPPCNDNEIIKQKFIKLLVDVCSRLRIDHMFFKEYQISATFADHYEVYKKKKVQNPSYFEKNLYQEMEPIVGEILARRIAIGTLSLYCGRFYPAHFQTSLVSDNYKQNRIATVFDKVRKQYGESALYYPIEKC